MAEQLRIGASRRDITPPVGSPLSGFIARVEPSRAVADPLHVRALVADAGDRRVGLVQADLLGLAPWHVAEVRAFADRQLGIPGKALMLSATHTHSGPGVVLVRGCEMASYQYQWEMVDSMKSALQEASQQMSEAVFEIGSTPYSMGLNRRQETSQGVVLGVAHEKPCPTRLDLARFKTSGQEILLFSHPCHPYVLGGESLYISGDFPSLACHELESSEQRFAFFLNGCAGNIAPVTAFKGIEEARREGCRLAETVEQGLDELDVSSDCGLAAGSVLLHLPYLPLPTHQDLEGLAAEEERVVRPEEREVTEIQSRIRAALGEWRTLLGRVLEGTWPITPVHCEVQAVGLGPLVLLGISGEPFYEIGQAIESGSPFAATWPLGYTNSYAGYIPTRKECLGGGYEVNDSWKYLGLWRISDACEELVVSAGQELLWSLKV